MSDVATRTRGLSDEQIRLYTDVENVVWAPSLYTDAVSMACEIRNMREVLKELQRQSKGECICPTCGIRHGSISLDGGF